MFKSVFKPNQPKVPSNTNKITFNHISFITSIDNFGNITIESFDSPLIKFSDKHVFYPNFWTSEKFINSFKLFGSSKLNDIEVNLIRTLTQKLIADRSILYNKRILEKWLFESPERFNQRKQILELLLDKTVEFINNKITFYEEITKEPDIELKLSNEEYEQLRKELFN